MGRNDTENIIGESPLQPDTDLLGIRGVLEAGTPRNNQGLKEKREYQKGVRLTGTENDRFEQLKTALGTDKDATALLRCFEFVWEQFGPEIEEIAEKKEKMKVL